MNGDVAEWREDDGTEQMRGARVLEVWWYNEREGGLANHVDLDFTHSNNGDTLNWI